MQATAPAPAKGIGSPQVQLGKTAYQHCFKVSFATFKLITNRWAWALVPTKLVKLGTALAWGGGTLSMATLRATPTQPQSPWCLKRRGQRTRVKWDLWLQQPPRTKRCSCIEKTDSSLPNEGNWQWERHQTAVQAQGHLVQAWRQCRGGRG